MKKYILFMIFSAMLFAATLTQTPSVSYANDGGITENAKSAYLIDYDSGTVIYAKNENEKLPIASMTKIMTTLLVIEEVEKGAINYDTVVTVSQNAAGMGGSQVFLDANSRHTVDSLLKTVIVASANDSAVALAEAVAGSESGFVNKMNSRAKQLAMNNTNFTNCTGLPAVNAYSSAKDVSIMLKELIKFDKYFEYSKIWLEDYVHPDGRTTTITNTNKLVRFYNGCDAGKTGYTSEALFCLSASAKREDMRIICTVIGEQNGKTRFADVGKMFNYAFANYENKILINKGEGIDQTVEVLKGKNNVAVLTPAENVCVFGKKGGNNDVELVFNIPNNVKAPMRAGEKVGEVSIVQNGVVVKTVDIVAAENIDKANFFDGIKRICENW